MASLNKIDKFYIWGIKGIIFLIPFIPLYVTSLLVFPYITGKNFAFRIMVELAAALWLGLISTNKEYRLRSSPITLSILFFTFIVGLADIFGVNPYKSFWSNYERMEGYITILHLALYFMIVTSVIKTRKEWTILLNIFVIVSFLVGIFALTAPLQAPNSSKFSLEYGFRVYGTIGNPPFLASYLLLSVYAGLILIVNTRSRYIKFIYLLPIIVSSVTIYFSASRGAILASFIGVIALSLFYMIERSGMSKVKNLRKAVLSVGFILIVLSGAFLTLRNTDLIKRDVVLSRFVNILSDTSVQTRFNAWKLAWEGFKERPVLGWGQENFIGVYTVAPIPLAEEQLWVDRAHNIILDWLVSAGILGLFSYIAIFGTSFYVISRAYKKRSVSKNEAFIISTAFGVYFIQNVFMFDTINTYLIFFTFLAYTDSFWRSEDAPGLGLKKNIPTRTAYKAVCAGLIALLIISGMSFFINYRPIRESQLFIQISGHDSFTALLNDYKKALSIESFGDSLVRQKMKAMSSFIIKKNLFASEGALKFIEATVIELEKEIEANPYDLERLTDTIISYLELAEFEPSFHARTESLIRRCIQLNPDYEWPYMFLIDLYIIKKDYEFAYNTAQKIVDSDPHDDKKQLKLVLTAILHLRDEVVSEALDNVATIRKSSNAISLDKNSYLSVDELNQIARAYNEVKNFQKALEYYQESINYFLQVSEGDSMQLTAKKLKREARIHFEMAGVYLKLGDKVSALKEADKAVKLDPVNFTGITEQIKTLNN
ncbi:hypothetical protein C4544_06030 [candidate division WS5 bacterium]|uniref:O-antigen ligase-related domain-containing protein n=1 Tax=candidate division WS5 bacterium TaxID=2093353 RepID=A0A419DAQ0_9BACT|nr:MAG: hypothetical protein C4544_06030 [candidate division WS5 bacterium]